MRRENGPIVTPNRRICLVDGLSRRPPSGTIRCENTGPPIHGVGIEFEEAPLPQGHAFFHGEKGPPPLRPNVVIAVGNCRLYLGGFGVRVEDTVLVTAEGNRVLTTFPRGLTYSAVTGN